MKKPELCAVSSVTAVCAAMLPPPDTVACLVIAMLTTAGSTEAIMSVSESAFATATAGEVEPIHAATQAADSSGLAATHVQQKDPRCSRCSLPMGQPAKARVAAELWLPASRSRVLRARRVKARLILLPHYPGMRIMQRLCIVILLAAAGCGGPGSDLPPLPAPEAAAYRLGPGDQVRIITFGEENLTGEFRVNDSGNVALPLIGGVRAAGLTAGGLEAAVGAALRQAHLVQKPSVAVEIIAYRPIYVLGEVNKPGQYAYQPGMTVVTAAAVAGGFTYRAIEDYAAVIRTVEGRAVEGKASRQAFVQPGDVVTVFERRF
jgi:polysaccharide export outer membrane protein